MIERPPMLSLCAMVLILFGMMALMNLVTAELQPETLQTMVGKVENPLTTAMNQSQSYVLFTKILRVPTALAGLLGIGAGIGLLQGSNTARKAGIAWAVAYFAMGIASAAANVMCAHSIIITMELPPAITPEMVEGARTGLMNSVLIGTVFTSVFVVVLSGLMVMQLTRPDSVAFCTVKPFSRQPAV